jgi:membrane associated rhomboid family serine protease
MFIDFAVLYAVCLFVPATVLFQVFHVGVVAVVVLGFFWAVLGGLVGREKGVAYNGAWIGALFGGLGVLLVLALRGDRHECSYCRSLVRAAAEICPYCENSQGDAVAPER